MVLASAVSNFYSIRMLAFSVRARERGVFFGVVLVGCHVEV